MKKLVLLSRRQKQKEQEHCMHYYMCKNYMKQVMK